MGDKVGNKTGDNSKLNNTQSKIFSEIRNNPNITKPQIAQLVGVGKTTIDNAIDWRNNKNLSGDKRNEKDFFDLLFDFCKHIFMEPEY